MFKALGFSAEEANDQFGFLLEAMDYGFPPHGGLAIGLDRFVMLLAGEENIHPIALTSPAIRFTLNPNRFRLLR